MTDKQVAIETIEQLPETATLDEIARRIEFVAAVRAGLDQIEKGESVSHEQIRRELAEWLSR